MPNDQDDADDLFGAAVAQPATPFPGTPSAEHRKESRVRANWQARLLLPGDRIIELNLHDLSETGLGLVAEVGIPAFSVLHIALAVPDLHDPHKISPVSGTIKTTHMTIRGQYIHCGGTWVQLPSASRELINEWVRRLRK